MDSAPGTIIEVVVAGLAVVACLALAVMNVFAIRASESKEYRVGRSVRSAVVRCLDHGPGGGTKLSDCSDLCSVGFAFDCGIWLDGTDYPREAAMTMTPELFASIVAGVVAIIGSIAALITAVITGRNSATKQEMEDLRRRVDELRNELRDERDANNKLRNKVIAAEDALVNAAAEKRELRKQMEALKGEVEARDKQIESQQATIIRQDKKIKDQGNKIIDLMKRVKELERKNHDFTDAF